MKAKGKATPGRKTKSTPAQKLTDLEKQQREEVLESGPKRVPNLTALAKEIGVARQTLHRWRRENPDFPKPNSNSEWDVRKVRDFIATHSLEAQKDDGKLSEREEQELRRLRAINERLELQLAIERGEYLSKEDVRQQVATAAHTLRRALRSLKGSLAPKVAGLTIAECARVIEKQVDELQGQLHAGVWKDIE